jgi:hypothetical protein
MRAKRKAISMSKGTQFPPDAGCADQQEWARQTSTVRILRGEAPAISKHQLSDFQHEPIFSDRTPAVTSCRAGLASFGFSHSQVAATVVTASGSLTEPRPAELLMAQALTGAGAGARYAPRWLPQARHLDPQ